MKHGKIICLGDSLTNGARDEFYRTYPMELADIIEARHGRAYVCVNHGVNGDTTSQILNRAYAALSGHRDGRLVLFLGGTNDSKVPIPLDIFASNIEGLRRLCAGFDLEMAIGLIPPVYAPGLPCYSPVQGNERIAEYNGVLRGVAAAHGLLTCDFTGYDESLYSDGVHLNHAGYHRMAVDWYEAIRERL